MEQKLTKKYGLITAIAMVVGTVIGSGVFFKAGKVLTSNNGSMAMSLLTVAAVGAIMVICSYVFSMLAQKYEKVNGLVDYAEATCGSVYAYLVGWFMTFIYYPTLTSTLAWISAQYTVQLFGFDPTSDLHLALAGFYLIAGYALNALSPKLAGKFQVSATFIKLIPLAFMAVVGTIVGLIKGTTIESMQAVAGMTGGSGFFGAVVAFAFAYEGWIITTSINAELKDSKKNLPRALILGSLIVVGVYLAYFLGLTGAMNSEGLMASGNIPKDAFGTLLGNPVFGTIASVFVIISCLGTMNGLMLGCCRGIYSISARKQGPAVEVLEQVDAKTNMPTNSSIIGLLLCAAWMVQWEFGIGQIIAGKSSILPTWIGWENDELPIITLYGMYIPIFIIFMIREKGLHPVKRFVLPGLASVLCGFMVYCAFAAYKMEAVYYLIVSCVVIAIGMLFYRNAEGKTVLQRMIAKIKKENAPAA